MVVQMGKENQDPSIQRSTPTPLKSNLLKLIQVQNSL